MARGGQSGMEGKGCEDPSAAALERECQCECELRGRVQEWETRRGTSAVATGSWRDKACWPRCWEGLEMPGTTKVWHTATRALGLEARGCEQPPPLTFYASHWRGHGQCLIGCVPDSRLVQEWWAPQPLSRLRIVSSSRWPRLLARR